MEATEATGRPYRTAVRWGLLLAGVVTVAMRVPELHRFYVQWHALEGAEQSVAQAYRMYFLVESGITAFLMAMAAGLFWALGPRRKQAE
jgi:hypothetical protein